MKKEEIQQKILDELGSKPSGRILLAPRFGKTRLIIESIKRDKPSNILWVTPSRKSLNEDIPAEFKKWGADKFLEHTAFVTWMGLKKVIGAFDLIILDEEQYITENNAQNLLSGQLTGRVISMTGTETRTKDKIEIFDRLKLKTIFEFDINKSVEYGLLSNYTINLVRVPLDEEKNVEIRTKKIAFKTSEYKQYAYLSEKIRQNPFNKFLYIQRKNFVYNSVSKTKVAKELNRKLSGRKLFFAGSIKQAEEISSYNYHSKTTDVYLKKFQNKEINNIAMVNAGGDSFTYEEVDNLVIVQANSDKNGSTAQKICRALLKQDSFKANIWIIVLANTQDEKWAEDTLKRFDQEHIKIVNYGNK